MLFNPKMAACMPLLQHALLRGPMQIHPFPHNLLAAHMCI